ncbi:hypothetical protein FHS18_003898 [Paenibacillus phyllosphaerae]|uniref:DUF4111 domain-containing protein n=1 Tax=Paenibacillus phyllosphaerae TaxID=274593 RepID=A0A7W5AZV9_9BACL|nr:nucleotidyltransferase domain-containing protein [Paenibacillus phyllosphaerae]MBB3111830.1 hypothetical protein [Paenibacillus phyllosphaerae]
MTTLPYRVEQTMNKLCSALAARMTTIEAVYLYGSVALQDYIEGSSDIDFIAVLRQTPTEEELEAIRLAHEEVEAELPNTDIMGSYILREELGKQADARTPIMTYFDKQVRTDGHGADLNPITWWILKQHGIRIYGNELPFDYELDENELTRYVLHNMNHYWTQWIDRLERQLALVQDIQADLPVEQLDEAVEWCALGMLRQLYTIRERAITSKVKAGLYAMEQLPERWHGVIFEAIAIKERKPHRYYSLQRDRLTDLVGLMRFIHLEANRQGVAVRIEDQEEESGC